MKATEKRLKQVINFQRDPEDSSGDDDESIDEFVESDVSESSEDSLSTGKRSVSDSIISIEFDVSNSELSDDDDEWRINWATRRIVLDRINAPNNPEDAMSATYRVTTVIDPIQVKTKPKKSADLLERMEAEMENLEYYRKRKLTVPKEQFNVVKIRPGLRPRSPLILTEEMKSVRKRLRNRNG